MERNLKCISIFLMDKNNKNYNNYYYYLDASFLGFDLYADSSENRLSK